MLGVPQIVLETSYYMVDLPELLKAKRKQNAATQLTELYLLIATNNRGMEDADYKKYIRGLTDELGMKQNETFNRDSFEQLRMLSNM